MPSNSPPGPRVESKGMGVGSMLAAPSSPLTVFLVRENILSHHLGAEILWKKHTGGR